MEDDDKENQVPAGDTLATDMEIADATTMEVIYVALMEYLQIMTRDGLIGLGIQILALDEEEKLQSWQIIVEHEPQLRCLEQVEGVFYIEWELLKLVTYEALIAHVRRCLLPRASGASEDVTTPSSTSQEQASAMEHETNEPRGPNSTFEKPLSSIPEDKQDSLAQQGSIESQELMFSDDLPQLSSGEGVTSSGTVQQESNAPQATGCELDEQSPKESLTIPSSASQEQASAMEHETMESRRPNSTFEKPFSSIPEDKQDSLAQQGSIESQELMLSVDLPQFSSVEGITSSGTVQQESNTPQATGCELDAQSPKESLKSLSVPSENQESGAQQEPVSVNLPQSPPSSECPSTSAEKQDGTGQSEGNNLQELVSVVEKPSLSPRRYSLRSQSKSNEQGSLTRAKMLASSSPRYRKSPTKKLKLKEKDVKSSGRPRRPPPLIKLEVTLEKDQTKKTETGKEMKKSGTDPIARPQKITLGFTIEDDDSNDDDDEDDDDDQVESGTGSKTTEDKRPGAGADKYNKRLLRSNIPKDKVEESNQAQDSPQRGRSKGRGRPPKPKK